MKISSITPYRQNNLSFGKFKDRKTARAVYDYLQKKAGEYQKDEFYEVMRDCDYITFSTDAKTGKVIATPRTDEEFKQSDLGEIAEYYIKRLTDWGYFADVTGGMNNQHGTGIAFDLLTIKREYKEKQDDPEGYARRRTPISQERLDELFERDRKEEERREREEMENKILTWYAQ